MPKKQKKFEDKYRYLANRETKEFHSIRRAKPQCQVDEIKERDFFITQKAAHDAGFDACGQGCVKKYKSRR